MEVVSRSASSRGIVSGARAFVLLYVIDDATDSARTSQVNATRITQGEEGGTNITE